MDQSYAYLYYDGTATQTLNTPVQIDVENGIPVYSYSNVIFNNANVSSCGHIRSFIQGSNYGGVVLERDGVYEIDFNFASRTISPLGIYVKAKKGNGYIVASFDNAYSEYKYTYHGKKGDMISIVASGNGPYDLEDAYTASVFPSPIRAYLLVKPVESSKSYAYLSYDGTQTQVFPQLVPTGVAGTTIFNYTNVCFNNSKTNCLKTFIQGSLYGGVSITENGVYEIDLFAFIDSDDGPVPLAIIVSNNYETASIVVTFVDTSLPYKYVLKAKIGDQISLVPLTEQIFATIDGISTTFPVITAFLSVEKLGHEEKDYAYMSYDDVFTQTLSAPIPQVVDGVTSYTFDNIRYNNIDESVGFSTIVQGSYYGSLILSHDGTYSLDFMINNFSGRNIGVYIKPAHDKRGYLAANFASSSFANANKYIFDARKGDQVSIVYTATTGGSLSMESLNPVFSGPNATRAFFFIKRIE